LSNVETFIVGFVASFLGTITGLTVQYYLHRKQKEQIDKLKKSIQGTVRRIKKK